MLLRRVGEWNHVAYPYTQPGLPTLHLLGKSRQPLALRSAGGEATSLHIRFLDSDGRPTMQGFKERCVRPMKPPSIVETINLTKVYGTLAALDRCSLQVEPGEVFGLLGPNG